MFSKTYLVLSHLILCCERIDELEFRNARFADTEIDRGNTLRFRSRLKKLQKRSENPQKLTQLSSRSHTRHLVGKRTAQKDTIIDITNDSQVNSNFPYRWSPASLTFNNYFYLFLYLYITRITINNNAPHTVSSRHLKQ